MGKEVHWMGTQWALGWPYREECKDKCLLSGRNLKWRVWRELFGWHWSLSWSYRSNKNGLLVTFASITNWKIFQKNLWVVHLEKPVCILRTDSTFCLRSRGLGDFIASPARASGTGNGVTWPAYSSFSHDSYTLRDNLFLLYKSHLLEVN